MGVTASARQALLKPAKPRFERLDGVGDRVGDLGPIAGIYPQFPPRLNSGRTIEIGRPTPGGEPEDGPQ